MAVIGRALTERFRRKLRFVEGRLGLADPPWELIRTYFLAPFFALAARCITDPDKLDEFKAILEAMRDGECDCGGAEDSVNIIRWLYGQAAERVDKAQRTEFRRETERLW